MSFCRQTSGKWALGLFLGVGTVASGAPYRVFDWQGKAAPIQPTEGPPGAGAVTHTTYLNGGQYWNGSTLAPMDVSLDVTVQIWDAPARWRVDAEGFLSGGNPATYGYQAPDEAEFNFGDPNGQIVVRFEFQFSQPVNNPSILLMDIDSNGSDHGTLFEAVTLGGGIAYPTLSIVPGSTVAWTGQGPTLDVFSNGGASPDNLALGSAFFEWRENSVTSISFLWESNAGTSIRVSNIYAEYDPVNFNQVVPEPSAALMALGAAGALIWRRRR
jgi:hypothetical protein